MRPPSSLFDANLAVLKETRPDIHAAIAQLQPSPFFERMPATAGGEGLRYKDGNREVVIASAIDPKAEADLALAETGFSKPPRIVVFYGLGLGGHVAQYLDNPNSYTEHVIVIERSLDVFFHCLCTRDMTRYLKNPNVFFSVGTPLDAIPYVMQSFLSTEGRYYYLNCLQNINWKACISLDPDYYVGAAKGLRMAIDQTLLSFGNAPEDAVLGLQNIMANRRYIHAGATLDSLRGRFAGKPGLVIASGPSMTASLPLLKDLAGRCVSACCDSALAPVLNAGYTPDFVVSLERYPLLATYFTGTRHQVPKDLGLLTLPLQVTEIYDNFPGTKIFCYPYLGTLSWLYPSFEQHYFGPTVSTMALMSLYLMGCSPIIIVGNDLAFDQTTGKTHLAGMLLDAEKDLHSEQKVSIAESMGNCGKPILTKTKWDFFRKTFEFLIERLGITLINAIPADQGLLIRGSQRMDFTDAIAKHLGGTFDIKAIKQAAIAPRGTAEATVLEAHVELCVTDALDFLSAFAAKLDDFAAFLASAAFSDIREAEQRLNAILTAGPMFQHVLFDLVQSMHIGLFNVYNELPGWEPEVFKRKVELLSSWTREMRHWTTRAQDAFATPARTTIQ